MSWLTSILADVNRRQRIQRAVDVIADNPERMEQLARHAEELAAKERADKYMPSFDGPWCEP